MMRCLVIFILLLFACPDVSNAQKVVKRSDLTVMLDNELHYLHTVRRKQTLYSIAAAYGTTVDEIVANNSFAKSGIKTGQTLIIPATTKKKELKQPEVFVEPQQPRKPTTQSTSQPEFPVPLTDDYFLPDYGDQGDQPVLDSGEFETIVEQVTFGQIKEIDRHRPIKIVMMLPFGGMQGEGNFVDFYRGVSMAFDQIERSGAEVVIEILSTSTSASMVEQTITSGRLADADMIIGPVYSDIFEIVADYALQQRIPIISPLGSVGAANNAMVIEVAPIESAKWDKLIPTFNDARSNVILVTSTTATDSLSLLQIEPLLPSTTHRIDYEGKATNVAVLSDLLRRDMKNVIVAPLLDESLVENLLSRYSSINVGGRNDITVVGVSRWSRFSNINLELFFKLSVVYPTTYFFDRMDENVAKFYQDYISRYESLPSLYSTRGYDVMMIFGQAIAKYRQQMFYQIVDNTIKVLQVPYNFRQIGDPTSRIINSEWALVQYLPSYRTEVL